MLLNTYTVKARFIEILKVPVFHPSPKSKVNNLHWFPVFSYISILVISTTQSMKPQFNFEKVRVIKLEKVGSSARFYEKEVDDNWPVCSLYLANRNTELTLIFSTDLILK